MRARSGTIGSGMTRLGAGSRITFLTAAGLSLALCSTAACSRTSDGTAAAEPANAPVAAAGTVPDTATVQPAPVAEASPAAAPATAPAAWDGTYTYAFDGGQNAGGSATVVTYTLALTPTSCRFSADGYQTDEDIMCTATRTPNSVNVAFKSYADGGTTDRYGNAVYSVGDPLFALERNGAKVFTRWKGYTLPDEKPHRPAVYFTR